MSIYCTLKTYINYTTHIEVTIYKLAEWYHCYLHCYKNIPYLSRIRHTGSRRNILTSQHDKNCSFKWRSFLFSFFFANCLAICMLSLYVWFALTECQLNWSRIGPKVISNNAPRFSWGLYNIRWYIKNCPINIDIHIGNLIKFHWIIKKVMSVYNMIYIWHCGAFFLVFLIAHQIIQ